MEKIALVTGASSGIGYETALALARDGYFTYAAVRNTAKGDDVFKAAKEEGLKIDVIKLDVDDAKSAESAVGKILSEKDRIDVLVNNAGYGQFGCTEDVTVDEFRAQFETNFFGIVQMIQLVAPKMRSQKSGTIINVSSVVGRMGLPGSPAYISTKFALEGLSECLRYELGQFGVRVAIIEPGVIKTDFFDSMRIPGSCADPKYKELTDRILAGLKMMVSMGTEPAEVARVIMGAIRSEEVLPRYTVGADAAMFMEAKSTKTDIEFEQYMSKELFSG